jgi:hypothetical protein
MRAHTITTTKIGLLLSLLTLGALGLVACGGGDDDEGTPAEAKVPPDTTAEASPPKTTSEAKLSPEQLQELEGGKQAQDLKRAANYWASRFATYVCGNMGESICARLTCSEASRVALESGWLTEARERRTREAIENCTPVSAAFQRSFADAGVEDIKFKGVEALRPSLGPLYLATVKFSNGVVVAFVGPGECGAGPPPGSGCAWYLAGPDQNRRFVQAATSRE